MVIAIRMERISRDADKLRSILGSAVVLLLSTEKQNEQRRETVFELVGKEKNGRHRAEKKKKRNTSQCKRANEPDANVANKHASMLNSLD